MEEARTPLIVTDTSVIVHLYIGPETRLAESVFQVDPHWAAPRLWRSEFHNVLATGMRCGRLSLERALKVTETAISQMQGHEHQPQSVDVLTLAWHSGCTAYDCEFVVVARNLGVKLVTFDRVLVSRFSGTAVSPADFAKSSAR